MIPPMPPSSGRGAPGAPCCAAGSKASPRRWALRLAAGRRRRARRGGRRAGRAVAAALVHAEIDVFLELAKLVAQPAVLELQLLDLAGQLAQLVFQPGRPHEQIGSILRRGRRGQSKQRSAKQRARRARTGTHIADHSIGASSKPVCASRQRYNTPSPRPKYERAGRFPKERAGPLPDPGGCDQTPPAPSSTVTARRFCDQQEMSLQTATGRSLP